MTAQHNHLIHVCVFKSFFPYYVDLCSHSRTDTLALIHTHSQSTYMLTETHTVQPLFFVVFLLCSDCVRVLCWSNSQTTVGALFVPSLLCDRYEGSPLCDQKTFLSLLSHSEPVWARVLTQEQPKCHLSPHVWCSCVCHTAVWC